MYFRIEYIFSKIFIYEFVKFLNKLKLLFLIYEKAISILIFLTKLKIAFLYKN